MIQPHQMALRTGINHDVTGSMIWVHVHAFFTAWTSCDDLQLGRVQWLRSVVRALINGTPTFDGHGQSFRFDQHATAGLAVFDRHVFDRTPRQLLVAARAGV